MRSPHDVLLKPIITEKSYRLAEDGKYTFKVDKKANKIEIKNAVEEIFKVKVLKVNTSRVKGKPKRVGRFTGKTPQWKKAVIKLREGDKIEIFENL